MLFTFGNVPNVKKMNNFGLVLPNPCFILFVTIRDNNLEFQAHLFDFIDGSNQSFFFHGTRGRYLIALESKQITHSINKSLSQYQQRAVSQYQQEFITVSTKAYLTVSARVYLLQIKLKCRSFIFSNFNIEISVVNGLFLCWMGLWLMHQHHPNHWAVCSY